MSNCSCLSLRQRDAITPAVEVLRPDQSEKLLPIIVDLIRVLCEKSNDQKVSSVCDTVDQSEKSVCNQILIIILAESFC